MHNIPNSKAYKGDETREILKEELEASALPSNICPTFYDLEAERGVDFRNFLAMMEKGSREEFKIKYDLVFLALNFTGYAQANEVTHHLEHRPLLDQPWYLARCHGNSVPKLTNHLIDVPQAKTLSTPTAGRPENIRA